MVDRPRLRRDDEVEHPRRQINAPSRRDGHEQAAVLDLQRAAGNQAVAELLGANGADAAPAVQRDEADATTGTGTMSIPDWKLDVPIQSFQLEASRPNREKAAGGEVHITFDKKHLDPRLMKAVTDGKQFEEITVQIRGRKITLRGVYFSSINMSGDFVSMSLNFGSIEFPEEGGGGGSGGGGSWDYEEGERR